MGGRETLQGDSTSLRSVPAPSIVSCVPAVRLLSFMLHDTKSRPYDHAAIVSQIGGFVFWNNAVNELTREGYIVQAGQTYRVNNAELKELLR